MATIRLIPSAYAVSSTAYLSVSNAENMYHNTDNTSYATITNTYASTSSRYLYLRGFNFGSIPQDAVINSFTVKVKGYESGLSTSTSYAPRLANGTSTISGTTASSNLGTSSKTITIPTGSLTWSQIDGYGENFTIVVYVRRSSKNNTGYAYIQGAEIEVNYTVPVYHSVTITNPTSATVTASDTNPLEGTDVEIRSNTLSGLTFTDNGVNVTSQFTQRQDSGESYSVTNITTTYGFAVNNSGYYESNNKAHASSAAVCRVDFYVPVSATITFSLINYAEATYDYGQLSNIDETLTTNASADTSHVYWDGKNHNSASVQTVTYTMAAGNHFIYVKYFKDQYTDSYNDSLQFKVAITLNEPFTPTTYYGYDIINITADHAIVVSSGGITQMLYFKVNGSWVGATKAYKKVNGSWVQQSDVTTVFNAQTKYVKG